MVWTMMFGTIFKRRGSSFDKKKGKEKLAKKSRRISECSINIQRVTGGFHSSTSLQSIDFRNHNEDDGSLDDSAGEISLRVPRLRPHLSINKARIAHSAPSTPDLERRTFSPPTPKNTSRHESAHNAIHRAQTSPVMNEKLDGSPYSDQSPKGRKSRNSKFHRVFKSVIADDNLLNHYSCAYCGDILLQGSLYISKRWFCFYSKILGKEKVIEIPVRNVLKITREKTAFIIPNAIGIHSTEGKYVFGSLISRDSAYKLMTSVWRGSQAMSDLKCESEDDPSLLSVSPIAEMKEVLYNNNDNKCHQKASGPVIKNKLEFDDMDASDARVEAETGPKEASCTDNNKEEARNETTTLFSIRCFCSKKFFSSLQRYRQLLRTVPTLYLLLAACMFMVLFLLCSAVVMSWKLVSLQSLMDAEHSRLSPKRDIVYDDIYNFNRQIQTTTIEKFHTVLKANLKALDNVQSSLRSLHTTGSPAKPDESCDAH